ncbi:MAG: ketopantoate reductase family protein [Chloroflexota bacterium]
MKLLVVGPGAMGTLFAGLLAEGGHEVWLLGRRPDVVETIARKGVTWVRGDRTRTAMVRSILQARDAWPVDLALIFVKAYDTLQAAKDALPAMGPNSVALTLQNGLNNVEAIASVVGRERTLAGVTAYGATLLSSGVVRHGGEGETAIGELDGRETNRLLRVADAFRKAGIEVEISHHVDNLIWGKLIINAAINPLTALLRMRNGQLLSQQETRELMATIALEGASVASSKGITLPYENPVEKAETVCRLTASNRSSMLQDVDKGKLTEIDCINGAVVREGRALGVPTPVNWTIVQLIKALAPTLGEPTRGSSLTLARPFP